MKNDQEIEKLWVDFSNISIACDDAEQVINESFEHFEKGSLVFDVWHWFDVSHSKGVHWLMYNTH